MKIKAEETFVMHLELTREEAEWLKAYMQNRKEEGEDIETAKNREALFKGLKSQGV